MIYNQVISVSAFTEIGSHLVIGGLILDSAASRNFLKQLEYGKYLGFLLAFYLYHELKFGKKTHN